MKALKTVQTFSNIYSPEISLTNSSSPIACINVAGKSVQTVNRSEGSERGASWTIHLGEGQDNERHHPPKKIILGN